MGLQDDFSGAWMDEDVMCLDTESEDEDGGRADPKSTTADCGFETGLKQLKPTQEGLKRVSFSFDEEKKQPKTYDLQDERSSSMGNVDESYDTVPVTERNSSLSEETQSEEPGNKQKAIEIQDELSSAWMVDDVGTL